MEVLVHVSEIEVDLAQQIVRPVGVVVPDLDFCRFGRSRDRVPFEGLIKGCVLSGALLRLRPLVPVFDLHNTIRVNRAPHLLAREFSHAHDRDSQRIGLVRHV